MEPDKVSKIKHKSYLNIPHTNIQPSHVCRAHNLHGIYYVIYIYPLLLSMARTEVKTKERLNNIAAACCKSLTIFV